MTYAGFLALFVVVPLAWVGWLARREAVWLGPLPLGMLLVVVYAAASPWDNAAVARGLWDFAAERLWGIRLGYLPLEEYLFFGLQTLLTGLWVQRRLVRAFRREEAP